MTLSDLLAAAVAIPLFAAFLGILIWKVLSPPLIIVCIFGLALAVFDFIHTAIRHRNTRRSSVRRPGIYAVRFQERGDHF